MKTKKYTNQPEPGDQTMEPEMEIIKFIQLWLIVYFSLTYTFLVGKLVSPGKLRFLLILPIVILFVLLPLRNTSITLLCFPSFLISWLAPFKLILYSFNKGPLPSITSLLHSASLPIRITPKSKLDPTPPPQIETATTRLRSVKRYAIKVVVISLVFKLYSFRARLHPTAIMLLYCLHIYILLELLLALVGAVARAGLGLDLEPQFNEPYLTTSLRDFWGRRWNLAVNDILRPTVYQPMISLLTGPLSRSKAQSVATLATFGVSGIMHQLIIYHMNRLYPTGQMTAFFLLNGICVVAETAVAKRLNGKWRLPRILASFLTILFVISTAFWLFFPEVLDGKIDDRSFQEYAAFSEFFSSVGAFRSFNGTASVHCFFKQLVSF